MSKRSVWLKTVPNNLAETTCSTPTSATGQTSSLGLGRLKQLLGLENVDNHSILHGPLFDVIELVELERSRSESDGTSKLVSFAYLARTFIKHNQNYYLKLDVSTSVTGLRQKKLVLNSSGSWLDGKTPCQESGRICVQAQLVIAALITVHGLLSTESMAFQIQTYR